MHLGRDFHKLKKNLEKNFTAILLSFANVNRCNIKVINLILKLKDKAISA